MIRLQCEACGASELKKAEICISASFAEADIL